MLRRALLLLALALAALAGASREEEDCEACGLLVWRMQTIAAAKQKELEALKAAKKKRSDKSTKAHSKRWILQEYKTELSAAIEEQIEALPKDGKITGGACRMEAPVVGSALRRAHPEFTPMKCAQRVESRCAAVLEDYQDELVAAVLKGKGASACGSVLDACSYDRAALLLGSQYSEDLSLAKLDLLQIGHSDEWTLHTDVDDSVYWFSRSRMKSVKEPPPGWLQDAASGKWRLGSEEELAALAAQAAPGGEPPREGAKEEL